MAKKRKIEIGSSELEWLARIKRLAIIAMFADDALMERFVLKGGNALDLVLHISTRASLDIDLSMEDDFGSSELASVQQRLANSLQSTFQPEGFDVFDVKLEPKPQSVSEELSVFWGGYDLTFKIINSELHREIGGNLDEMRRNATLIGGKGKFEIDISRFEYCQDKKATEFEGYRIYVYTPEMLVSEKLRAICQQMPEYGPVIKRTRPTAARARDFLDIHSLVERYKLNMWTSANVSLLKHIFQAKRVPLNLIGQVPKTREFHRLDFESVRATVKPGIAVQNFDFYFDFVVALCERLLKSFGDM